MSAFDRDCVCPVTRRANARLRAAGHPKTVKGLVNARLLAGESDSFVVPSDASITRLKPGDYVKLCRNNERFWVKIDGYIARKWHGTVSNKLVRNEDLNLGDKIFFMRKNIYDLKYS